MLPDIQSSLKLLGSATHTHSKHTHTRVMHDNLWDCKGAIECMCGVCVCLGWIKHRGEGLKRSFEVSEARAMRHGALLTDQQMDLNESDEKSRGPNN